MGLVTMSKKCWKISLLTGIVLMIFMLFLLGRRSSGLVRIPEGHAVLGSWGTEGRTALHAVDGSAFYMGRYEVTLKEFSAYLNAQDHPDSFHNHSQFTWDHGVFRVAKGCDEQHPIACITVDEARGYCAWLSRTTGKTVRLPTVDEWERAARGGLHRAPYPWGWGAAQGRSCWRAESARVVGAYEPNAYGLYDMAGNVYEWCADGSTACGGAWSEHGSEMLKVDRRELFPEWYKDADVGFRILVE